MTAIRSSKMTPFWLFSYITAACLVLHAAQAQAEEVWLNPGYISGEVYIEGVDTSYARLDAKSGEFTATTTTSAGNYTLTVNTPVNGSLSYETGCYLYSDGYKDFLRFPYQSVLVTDAETSSLDFTLQPGFIKGTITSSDGCTICKGRVYASADASAAGGYLRDSSTWVGARTDVGSDGIFYFPVAPGENITISAKITMGNGEEYNLETKWADIEPGAVAEVTWPVECNGQLGAISGAIGINGVTDITKHNVRAHKSGSNNYINAAISCENMECLYSFENLSPGDWYVYAISDLNNEDDRFYYPRGSYTEKVTVLAGQTTKNDIIVDAAYLNGTLTLRGTKSLADASTAEVMAYGGNGTISWAGNSYDFANLLNGEFDLILSTGDWRNYLSRIYFYDREVEDYLRSYLYIYDNSQVYASFTAGETVNNHALEYLTGSVTVRYTVDGGGVLSSPRLTGNNYTTAENLYSYIYAYGPTGETTEGKVTFIGLPGSYHLIAQAYVGGSMTTFGELDLDVVQGGERELDIGSPSLSVESPQPETYLEGDAITISGTTTDTDGIKSITINSDPVDFSSTENANDPNEVAYSKEVGLEPGPNSIQTVITDNLGKSISDTRNVYRDSGPPSLEWTPANNTSTAKTSIVASGTATDDNTITSIKVNGSEVEFASTNNPDDLNEVEFSAEVALNDGDNQIVVSATDNCEQTTSETHTITKIEADTVPPAITCPADLTVEYGDTITLGQPSVWDNTDSSPKVENNAPSSYQLGLNTITWTATDSWGNSSSCTQKVNLVDNEAPAIICPADITVNLGDAVNLGSPAATDNADADLEISVDRPESFESGETLIVWQAKDDSGNIASCKQSVTVLDDTVKEFSVKADTDMLWPPNHKYVTVQVAVSAVTESGNNLSDKVKLAAVTSDEPEEAREKNSKKNKGDGNTVNDIVILDDNTVQLRAERLGNGDGRVYTFHYTLTDAAGNTHTATASVSVPHSIKSQAIDSGVHYTVKP